MSYPVRSLLPFITATIALAMLGSCADLFDDKKTTPVTPKTLSYDAATYVEQLSIARMKLENRATISSIAEHSKVIEAYSNQKPRKTDSMFLAVMEYGAKDAATIYATIPIRDNDNPKKLSKLLTPVESLPYELKNIKVTALTVQPSQPFRLSKSDPSAARRSIIARHNALVHSGKKIMAIEEASLQLKLLHYFMQIRYRDAAYIAANNVKGLLSVAMNESNDTARINALTKALEEAESDLRRKMPY